MILPRAFLLVCFLWFFSSWSYAEPLLSTIQGEKISFERLQGKWVLINYWASWCGPCLEEIKELNRFYDLNKKNIALFAVNFDFVPLPKQLQLIKKFNIRYPSLLSDPRQELGLGEIRGVPATFVFDPQGHLKTTLYGAQTFASLTNIIMPNA